MNVWPTVAGQQSDSATPESFSGDVSLGRFVDETPKPVRRVLPIGSVRYFENKSELKIVLPLSHDLVHGIFRTLPVREERHRRCTRISTMA